MAVIYNACNKQIFNTIDNGITYYNLDRKLHREDGPAVEWFSGRKEWWLDGKYYDKNNEFNNETWDKFIKTLVFL